MASRSVRRREHKQLARLAALDAAARRVAIGRHLALWRAEAMRRADDLGEPAVWELEAREREKAWVLGGADLADDLRRVCADAVASAAGRHLTRGSRPLADRVRVRHVTPPPGVSGR